MSPSQSSVVILKTCSDNWPTIGQKSVRCMLRRFAHHYNTIMYNFLLFEIYNFENLSKKSCTGSILIVISPFSNKSL